ncbi:MAG TPA: methyltransferase domain-containing protein [Candidatus Angelobacter sp.]|nr:methyltransferase domain-containing protein [Candidatus Angelobacter sp.]
MDIQVAQSQDKSKEIQFFDRHAAKDDYNVFTDAANRKLIDAFVRLSAIAPGALVADLGCGSGIFTSLLHERGYKVSGLDISYKLLELARHKYPSLEFFEGDVEDLPFASRSLDCVLLSGIVHHLPDPGRCATEVFRVIRPGGSFMAFDPNRRNPFMWLYRDHGSPFYSSKGVTENERPVMAETVSQCFEAAGFKTGTDYLSGLSYRYVASSLARLGLPVYNFLDQVLFRAGSLKRYSPFLLTYGVKP